MFFCLIFSCTGGNFILICSSVTHKLISKLSPSHTLAQKVSALIDHFKFNIVWTDQCVFIQNIKIKTVLCLPLLCCSAEMYSLCLWAIVALFRLPPPRQCHGRQENLNKKEETWNGLITARRSFSRSASIGSNKCNHCDYASSHTSHLEGH